MSNNSSKSVIVQLVALLKGYGIRHVVVSPGSRNAPIVHTLANQSWLTCYPVTDERSAAFVAVGLSDSLSVKEGRRVPVGVCCTSGSAVLDMAPAVAEAHYRNVPLLVISADRPEAWIGQMDGQTLKQSDCFGALVPSFSLREGDDEETHWYRNRILNEALTLLSHNGGGPVHINVHLSEPLFDFQGGELPTERVIAWRRENVVADVDVLQLTQCAKTMIVVGQSVPVSKTFEEEIRRVIADDRAVVVAETLSNISHIEGVITNIDAILASNDLSDDLSPRTVVYIGGHIVSKRLKQYLRGVKPSCSVRLTDSDHIEDTFMCLTHQYPESTFAAIVNALSSDNGHFASLWRSASLGVQPTSADELFTSQSVVSAVLSAMSDNTWLSLANSSAVRLVQSVRLSQGNVVFCNRGVNGIDGSLSAAVGQALATDNVVLAIIGDLSFLYDMNALWNVQLPSNLRILLLNNGGGDIFKTLRGLEKSEYRDKYVMARHTTTVEGWASDARCNYKRISSADELPSAVKFIFSPQERCSIVEVML